MMNGRPNDPEYCQNIYEAAKKAIEEYDYTLEKAESPFCTKPNCAVDFRFHLSIENLKRALEGKENV